MFTFWNYYILKILRFEIIIISDATLSDINVVLCYLLSQYHADWNYYSVRAGFYYTVLSESESAADLNYHNVRVWFDYTLGVWKGAGPGKLFQQRNLILPRGGGEKLLFSRRGGRKVWEWKGQLVLDNRFLKTGSWSPSPAGFSGYDIQRNDSFGYFAGMKSFVARWSIQ